MPGRAPGRPSFVLYTRPMTEVSVFILHPTPARRAGEIEAWVAAARMAIADHHRVAFQAAGAREVTLIAGPPDRRSFGARVRELVAARRPAGLVVLGSGAIPLATVPDLRRFVEAAASPGRVALANNRYSADVIAVSSAATLAELPDLATDNALPRWLAEVAGYEVSDLRGRWRLGVDIDGPLDLILIGRKADLPRPPDAVAVRVVDRLNAVSAIVRDPRCELIVSGRLSAANLAWLERSTASRTRALIEERGFRTRTAEQRPARSSLGLVLDRDGPEALGARLAELGDGAIVDSRVLLAHRFGADERGWPAPADRFASDLLLHERIADDWLRELSRSAAEAPIPVVLGGHSLVGPGLRLALRGGRAWT
jgi:hypothetical protein